MKKFLAVILVHYLRFCAKVYLRRTQASVVAVTGTTNTFTAKQEITDLLARQSSVRTSRRNYTAKYGVPASILNVPLGGDSFVLWAAICYRAFVTAFLKREKIDIIVLELAIKRIADMQYVLRIVSPKVAVVTNVLPSGFFGYEQLDSLAQEYLELARAVPPDGLVLLNAEDDRLNSPVGVTAKTEFYGIEKGDVRAQNISEDKNGTRFTIGNEAVAIPTFGRHNILAYVIAKTIQNFYAKKEA